jgi:propionyl-CoA carboxylase alpha chain
MILLSLTPRIFSSLQKVELTLGNLDWQVGNPLAQVTFNNEDDSEETSQFVQFLGRSAEGYSLRYKGSEHDITIRTPKEHELSKYMLKPEKKDLTNLVLSPMPGTLISLSVKVGQHVEAGQQLAVLEAMKMQVSDSASLSILCLD